MIDFPQIQQVSIYSFIDEIKRSLENKNFLSALSVSLMIPDICSKISGGHGKKDYAEWFNKYVYSKHIYSMIYKTPDLVDANLSDSQKIEFNGYTCYALRCAILHSGKAEIDYEDKNGREKATVDNVELCLNSKSSLDSQYGDSVSITTRSDESKFISIRINIIKFVENMINGCNDFLIDNNYSDVKLFSLIDWDKLYNKDSKN